MNAAARQLSRTLQYFGQEELARLLIEWADAGDALSSAYVGGDAAEIGLRRAKWKAADAALVSAARDAGLPACGQLLSE
ncbi:MAG TPA: hypothetical protein VFR35_11980 [Actinoplanes sp.]|nr:hypothetical protein [Actinoplanes sp.]